MFETMEDDGVMSLLYLVDVSVTCLCLRPWKMIGYVTALSSGCLSELSVFQTMEDDRLCHCFI